MTLELETLSGEELLLLSIFGGAEVHAAVERELDRRAVHGPPRKARAQARPVARIACRRAPARLVA